VNEEVLDLTSSPSITDRFRMISSVRPSTKYSLFGSALRFLNGRTAIAGVSDVHQGNVEPKLAAITRMTPTAMYLHLRRAPIAAVGRSSMLRGTSQASSEA